MHITLNLSPHIARGLARDFGSATAGCRGLVLAWEDRSADLARAGRGPGEVLAVHEAFVRRTWRALAGRFTTDDLDVLAEAMAAGEPVAASSTAWEAAGMRLAGRVEDLGPAASATLMEKIEALSLWERYALECWAGAMGQAERAGDLPRQRRLEGALPAREVTS